RVGLYRQRECDDGFARRCSAARLPVRAVPEHRRRQQRLSVRPRVKLRRHSPQPRHSPADRPKGRPGHQREVRLRHPGALTRTDNVLRGSTHGIRLLVDAVFSMRTVCFLLALVCPALSGGAMLAAQAVERTDVPARGILRVTFDPRIMTWNDEFTDAGRLKLGAPLTGDTVGGRYIPVVARLEQNVRVASGLAGF